MTLRILLTLLIGVAVAGSAAAQGRTQKDTGTPNAMQGFSKNKGQPVHIEAERLEVHDKDKTAIFTGKVVVTQGDTTMRCKTLTVYYVGSPAKDAKDTKEAAPKPTATVNTSGEQKIKKLEASGDVVVNQNDQVATGDKALFDMDTNTVTMTGGSSGVVLTQGQNVLRGTKLVVDMTTGYSRVESGNSNNGRVQGLFVPSGNGQNSPMPGKPDNKQR
jgi:lipopolysaccharide export system protein LptA